VVIEYDELPRAALELLSGGPGPERLKRFTDLSTYYRTVTGPASTAGMTMDQLRAVASEVRRERLVFISDHAYSQHASGPRWKDRDVPPAQPPGAHPCSPHRLA
jgi:hypothetical protein